MFGGTEEEQFYWMLGASFVLIYHAFFVALASGRLTADDLMCALVNAHTLPINTCVYSTPIYKPLKWFSLSILFNPLCPDSTLKYHKRILVIKSKSGGRVAKLTLNEVKI